MSFRQAFTAAFYRKERWILFFIFLLALGLRIKGIHLLLPYFESGQDERLIIESALRVLKTGDLNPHFFWYGSFPIYWAALLYGLVLGIECGVSGGISSIRECISGFGIYDQGFLLFYLGRVSSIIFGLGTIYLVYLIGKKLFGKETGYLAAFLLAISPLHIYFSQIFKVDISLLFWILLAFYFSFNIYKDGTYIDYVGTGIACGLALGTKYFFLAFFPFLIAFFFPESRKEGRGGKGFLALYVMVFTFILTCPFSLLSFSEFLSSTYNLHFLESIFIYGRADVSSAWSKGLFRLGFIFPLCFGPLIYLMSVGGLMKISVSDWRRGLFLAILPAAYFMVSTWLTWLLLPQYQFPLLPFVILAGAYMMVELLNNKSKGKRLLGWAALLFSTVFFISDLKLSHFNGVYRPYQEAAQWIDSHVPRDKKILTYWWVYDSTGHFNFIDEYSYQKANELSGEEFGRIDPEWAVLVDSKIFEDQFYSSALGRYSDLIRQLKSKENSRYQLMAAFSPSPLWEKIIGYLYQEFSGFQILVFQKK